MFHPEVVHTPDGAKLLPTSSTRSPASQATGRWRPTATRRSPAIREQVGDGRVICALSGGVDSSVAALLIHEAIGEQLTCIFVDHGLMRKDEAAEVVAMFRGHYNIPLVHVDAASASSPRSPAWRIRRRSARRSAGCSSTFSRRRRKLAAAAAPDFLAQGTLYPDVIESVSFTAARR